MKPTGAFVGAATLDLHYLMTEYPASDSKGPADRFGIYAGGPAANAAVAFAHMGGVPRLYAEVGIHPLGRAIAADLAGSGVELVDLVPDSIDPPMVSSVITTAGSGDRMVAASHYPDEGALAGLPVTLPPDTSVLLVDGFLRVACEQAVDEAARRRIPIVLDGGSWKPAMGALLPAVDVAICSESFRPPETSTHAEVFEYLQSRGVQRVAITRGGGSILYREAGVAAEVAVAVVPVVDTLGAGDIFHGAFCYYLTSGGDFRGVLSEAAAVASHSCRSFGTREWMSTHPGR